ncbi:MAG TPA: hypothetical protein VIU83_04395, partial [Candidatus Deferrimicrobium sp.]
PQSGADLAVSPDGNTVAVFARRERGRDLLLLNALDGGIRERIEMPGLDQQLSPAFSPDGKLIAFRALKGGTSDIYGYDIASKTITDLTQDNAFDFGPAFSPDGKWLYYSSSRGTKLKIFRLNPGAPETREQVTYGDWNDEDPSLSPDGKRLFITSDRDQGIYNIYSINLDTGETLQHTNVVAGVFSPTVFIGRDNTEKLVFTAYYKRRFTLYVADSKKFVKRLPDLAPAVSPAGPSPNVPFTPSIEVSLDPEKVQSKISRKLQLEDASINAGVNIDQTFLSNTILIFGDNLGDRRFIASLQSISTYTNIYLAYLDLTHRLQKGITLLDDREYYVGIDTSQGLDRQVRARRFYRETGGAGIVIYPLNRYLRVEGQLGYISRSIDYPAIRPDGRIGFLSLDNNFPLVTGALVGDTTLYREWGPLAGHRFRLGGSYFYDTNKGTYGDFRGHGTGPTLSADVTLDYRQYIKVTARSLLAFRLFGARATGNLPNIYYFGGLDTLRGLDYASVNGNTVAYANFEYRFPLIDFLAFPIGGFRDIRGRVFFDIGGGALKGQHFRLWDSNEHRLLGTCVTDETGARQCLGNAIAAYGYGLEFTLLGLQLHWDFSKRTDLKKSQGGL